MNEVNGGGCKVLVVPREESGRCNADAEEFIVLMSKIALCAIFSVSKIWMKGGKNRERTQIFYAHQFILSLIQYPGTTGTTCIVMIIIPILIPYSSQHGSLLLPYNFFDHSCSTI